MAAKRVLNDSVMLITMQNGTTAEGKAVLVKRNYRTKLTATDDKIRAIGVQLAGLMEGTFASVQRVDYNLLENV